MRYAARLILALALTAPLLACEHTQTRAGVNNVSVTTGTQDETDHERLLRFKRQTQRDQINEYFRHQHQRHDD